jgi:hypothetical protein
MQKTKKYALLAGAALLALFASFTAGRYSAPTKVVEVEKEKIVQVVDQKAILQAVAHAKAEWRKEVKDNTRVVYKYLDGKVIEKVVYVDRVVNSGGSTSSDSSTSSSTQTNSTTVVEKEKTKEVHASTQPRFSLGVNAGAQWDQLPSSLSFGGLTYEGHAGVRIVGGVWANVTVVPQLKFAGVGLTLQF